MPNPIKNSATYVTGTVKSQSWAIGMDSTVAYGPTGSTGFWTGITPPAGGYTLYVNKASQGPSITVPNNDAQLIDQCKRIGGTNINTVTDALSWFSTNGVLCANRDYPDIPTSGLAMIFDPGYTGSYPRTGTELYDMSTNGINGTLTNGPTYSTSGGGSIVLDGSNDWITCGTSGRGIDLGDKTLMAWIKPAALTNAGIIDKDFDTSPGVYGGWGLWLQSNGKLWFWNHSNKDLLDTGPATVSTTAWTHVAVTWTVSNKTANFYINGALNSTKNNSTISELSSGTSPLAIGATRGGVFNLNGSVGQALGWTRALSAAEILRCYNSTSARYA